MSEIQDLNDLYRKLKLKQIQITTKFIQENVGRHKYLLDLSNKYLFESCILKLKKTFLNVYTNQIPLRYLILQNCLLTSSSSLQVFSIFLNFPGKINLTLIDLGNNSISFSPGLSSLITKVLERTKSDERKLKLQGNIIRDKESLAPLVKVSMDYATLTFYDCCLPSDVLISLSDQISQDLNISKLDLGYNPSCFVSKSSVFSFGVALGMNSNLQCLKLSGIASLAKVSFIEKLVVGLKNSTSIEKLVLSNIPFGDKGLKILRKMCFGDINLKHLDLQNTGLTNVGLGKFLLDLPSGLNSLVIAYNLITESKFLAVLGRSLTDEKDLRHLNISYCFCFQSVDTKVLNGFCEGITINRSLSELFLEGCKIEDDPDEFCKMMSIAIEERKYPICFKISAVRDSGGNAEYMSKTEERILKDITG